MHKSLLFFDRLIESDSRKIVSALNIFLFFCIVISVLFSIREIAVTRYTPQTPFKKDLIPAKKQEKTAFNDYAVILKNNPFGFPAGELRAISPSTVQTSAQAAPTDFFLIGTITGPGTRSFGVFVSREGKQEIFRLGSQVFGAGKLRKVKKDRVVLETGGSEREMELVELKDLRAESNPATSPSPLVVKRDSNITVLDQRRIQQSLDNPQQIMTDARFLPHYSGGRQEGFVLSEVKPGGIYSSLGLMNGDVILRINEHAISSPDNALQAFTALKGMERVQLDIIRNSGRMTMNYVIR